jgi:hypothetical protein
VSDQNWPRIGASAAIWALVYNAVWGLTWFAFMRTEWLEAVAAIGEPLPWTPAVWLIWALLSLLIALAIMTHAAGQVRARKAAVTAACAGWLLLTMGMAWWSVQQSLSLRVIALDSTVNLVGMVAGSLAGAPLLPSG